MPMVYCQLFSGEELLANQLLISIDREPRPNEKAPDCTFRVPADQLKTIREHLPLRLEFPEKIARRLKIAEGNSLHIVAHQIHDRIAHFGEARASEE
jgi:hypothetical protein